MTTKFSGWVCIRIAVLVAMCCRAPEALAADAARSFKKGTPPPSQLLAKWERHVHWTAVALEVDLTGDGVPDAVVLGRLDAGMVVGIVEGPMSTRSRHWTLVFPVASDAQDAICGTSESAELAIEDVGLPLDELGCSGGKAEKGCERLIALRQRLEAASGRGAKGVRLDAGDCDAFHIFFDGSGVQYIGAGEWAGARSGADCTSTSCWGTPLVDR